MYLFLQNLASLIAVKGIKLTGKETEPYDVVFIKNKTCFYISRKVDNNFTKLIGLKSDVKIQQIRYHFHLY